MSPSLRVLVLILAALLAACQSAPKPERSPATAGRPHYKVGAPYLIDGRRYVPAIDTNYDEVGIASWYGDEFHGKPTANGEIFDKRRLSAAHKTLPMPTLVEVENLENGKRVLLRLNDRGPFVDNRIIDLSHAAANELGFSEKGLAQVRVRYVGEAALNELAPLNRQQSHAAQPAPVAVGAPKPTRAGPQYWVELRELASLQLVNIRDADMLGAIAVVTDFSKAQPSYSMRIGPYIDLSEADKALVLARHAGFAEARILQGSTAGSGDAAGSALN